MASPLELFDQISAILCGYCDAPEVIIRVVMEFDHEPFTLSVVRHLRDPDILFNHSDDSAVLLPVDQLEAIRARSRELEELLSKGSPYRLLRTTLTVYQNGEWKCLHNQRAELWTILGEIFDKVMRSGMEALSPSERELYRVEDFINGFENGGLSGYFYNTLPDLDGIHAAVVAMRQNGLSELADLLEEAAGLFAGYVDPDPPTTWGKVCARHDPDGRLNELSGLISALGDDFGLSEGPDTFI